MDHGREDEVITRLARIGYDSTIGYLIGGFRTWKNSGKEIDKIVSISADEFFEIRKVKTAHILNARKETEFTSEHLIGAENLPLNLINESMPRIEKEKTYYVHCAAGYRSMIFISTLRARGFDNLIHIKGGFKALKESGHFELSEFDLSGTL